MNLTNKETYKIIRAVLKRKRFTQYQISKEEKITFSLVNRVINWLVARSFVAKTKGEYILVAPTAILGLFPIYRKMKPYATFDVNIPKNALNEMLKKNGTLCLTSALSVHDNYYRDNSICAYFEDEKIIEELKEMKKGYTRIKLYKEDLNKNDSVKIKGQNITSTIRTVIDLFCANKAYAAERLIKKEWA